MKVLMLLYSSFVNDSRVDRCAKTLARAGCEVTLLATHEVGLPVEESINGYRVVRSQWEGELHITLESWLQDIRFLHPSTYRYSTGPLRFFVGAIIGHLIGDPALWNWLNLPTTNLASLADTKQTLSPRTRLYASLYLQAIAPITAERGQQIYSGMGGGTFTIEETITSVGRDASVSPTAAADDRIRIEALQQFKKRRLKYRQYASTALAFARDFNPNLVHAHDFNTLLAANTIKAELGTPYIYDSHELWVHRNRRRVKFLQAEVEWEERAEAEFLHQAAASITVCDSIADYLASTYQVPRPVVVRNTPESLTYANRPELSLRSALALDAFDFVLIYVGRITYNRGVFDILRALQFLGPDVKLVMLGLFDRVFESDFRQGIREFGLGNRVRTFGPVPSLEVADWIKEADLSLTTMTRACLSYTFTLPNKLFESIQARVPILGPDSPEIVRVVERFQCGTTYKDGNPQDLARVIQSLRDNPDALQQLKANTLPASQELCWEREQAMLLGLYEQLGLAREQISTAAKSV